MPKSFPFLFLRNGQICFSVENLSVRDNDGLIRFMGWNNCNWDNTNVGAGGGSAQNKLVHDSRLTIVFVVVGFAEVHNNHLEFNFIQFVIRWPSLRD